MWNSVSVVDAGTTSSVTDVSSKHGSVVSYCFRPAYDEGISNILCRQEHLFDFAHVLGPHRVL